MLGLTTFLAIRGLLATEKKAKKSYWVMEWKKNKLSMVSIEAGSLTLELSSADA